ncbi:hypothetical protein [Streptomyces sp. NPDC052107]|uniref:AI-2E family transporter n=1 Tax=Streptomyces sp. NPDC052107 TaxID=3155632 RepID=UPI00343F4954
MATLLVFLAAAATVAAVVALFVIPLAQEGSRFAGRLPAMIRDAWAGHGPVGNLLERTHALQYIQRHQAQIRALATGLSTPALKFIRSAASTAAGALTIFVLAYLMVLEGPRAIDRSLALVDEAPAARIRRVGAACARTVNGYLTGNLGEPAGLVRDWSGRAGQDRDSGGRSWELRRKPGSAPSGPIGRRIPFLS